MLAAALACMALAASALAETNAIDGTATVGDGDTIRIGSTKIRLHGVDAPELHQKCTRPDGTAWACGEAAKAALVDIIANRVVVCVPLKIDRYSRIVASCTAEGIDIEQAMVERGMAVAYRRYSLLYVAAEESARRRGVGIWSGSFEMPWDYRAAHPRVP